jgi:transcription elongation factor Elf1
MKENETVVIPAKKEEKTYPNKYFNPSYKAVYTCRTCGSKAEVKIDNGMFSGVMLCAKDKTQMAYEIIAG